MGGVADHFWCLSLSAPLLRQLCGSGFFDEASSRRHLRDVRAGEAECRKRVMYLMQERGPHPLTSATEATLQDQPVRPAPVLAVNEGINREVLA